MDSLTSDGSRKLLADFFASDIDREGLQRAYEMPSQKPALTTDLLCFTINNEAYGLEVSQIQEILKVPKVAAVPRASSSLVGVFSLRGTMVPIVDLRVLLGVEQRSKDRHSRILVLRDLEPLGLLVDEVTHVRRLNPEHVEPLPKNMRGDKMSVLQGVARQGESFVMIIDLSTLLPKLESLV